MAKASGKTTYVSFDGVDLSVTLRNFKVERRQNEADSTAGADAWENTVPTTKSIKATANFVIIKAADGGAAIRAVLTEGNEGPLLYGFEGNGTGKPKGGFTGRVASYVVTSEYKNVIMGDVEFSNAAETLLFDDASDTW